MVSVAAVAIAGSCSGGTRDAAGGESSGSSNREPGLCWTWYRPDRHQDGAEQFGDRVVAGAGPPSHARAVLASAAAAPAWVCGGFRHASSTPPVAAGVTLGGLVIAALVLVGPRDGDSDGAQAYPPCPRGHAGAGLAVVAAA